MLQRCENPRSHGFPWYGAQGIQVCTEWHNVAAFVTWIETNLGPRPEGMSLDRIDASGHYEPGNVRWATWKQQRANHRT
jgi:hypothetical protein